MKMKKCLFVVLAFFLSACSYAVLATENEPLLPDLADQSPAGNEAVESLVADDSYIIQPGDALKISVWKEPSLLTEALVRPDGVLTFPLVGDIVASGRTVQQLKTELAAKLTKYVPDPVLTVSVTRALGNKIYVVGKVNRPGEYVSNRRIDVMQALAMAGGPTPFASVNKIKILRRENGVLKSIPFRYSDVAKGKKLEQNIIVRGGDVIVVP
jgi:polysaccharide export outer membrane protein